MTRRLARHITAHQKKKKDRAETQLGKKPRRENRGNTTRHGGK